MIEPLIRLYQDDTQFRKFHELDMKHLELDSSSANSFFMWLTPNFPHLMPHIPGLGINQEKIPDQVGENSISKSRKMPHFPPLFPAVGGGGGGGGHYKGLPVFRYHCRYIPGCKPRLLLFFKDSTSLGYPYMVFLLASFVHLLISSFRDHNFFYGMRRLASSPALNLAGGLGFFCWSVLPLVIECPVMY